MSEKYMICNCTFCGKQLKRGYRCTCRAEDKKPMTVEELSENACPQRRSLCHLPSCEYCKDIKQALLTFAAQEVEKEREECAKVAEDRHLTTNIHESSCANIAKAIRSRSAAQSAPTKSRRKGER